MATSLHRSGAWLCIGAFASLTALFAFPGRADAPAGHFTIANGLVTDNKTGLIWQRNDDGTGRSYAAAVSYCDGLSLGGYTDWRLATIKELLTLVDESKASDAIDLNVFPGGNLLTWSGSPVPSNVNYSFAIDFSSYGSSLNYTVTSTYLHARCVRP
ncbi:MAG: DUF1566 domain-containing protein [Pseudomonadota bacterium]